MSKHHNMKKNKLILGTVIGLLIFGTSCQRNICLDANGAIVSEQASFDDIKRLEVDMKTNVYVQSDADISEPYYILEAPENVIDEIEMIHSGSRLRIKTDRCISTSGDINLWVYTNNFEKAELNGSGTIVINGNDFDNSVDLDISGSGVIDAELDVNKLDVNISGSGEVYLYGSANDLDVNISGSGDLYSYQFLSQKTDVRISGSGNSEVAVADDLDVNISGSGNVFFIGFPDVWSSITGSGRVEGMN